ncbi:MAG TPA: cytochrome c biogenesis protein CcdA [Gemmataceae bacterium]|nr:cytochrome c biogenesis protein CcdA [Gemmataceae bacterium]
MVLFLLVGVSAVEAAPPEANSVEWIAGGNIGFSLRVESADPFATAYQVGVKASDILQVRRGEVFRLTITGRLKPEWHTYPLEGLPGQVQLAKLVYTQNSAFAPLWPVRATDGTVVNDKAFGTVKEYEGEFQWSQEVLVLKDAPLGKQTLKVLVDSQVCHDRRGCIPIRHSLEAVVEVLKEPVLPVLAASSVGLLGSAPGEGPLLVATALFPGRANESAVELTSELEKRLQEKPPSYAIILSPKQAPAPGKVDRSAASGPSPFLPSEQELRESMARMQKQTIVPKELLDSGGGDTSLLAFLLAGVFWGAVSLVTPCVFPMIPITVSFFLKQSEKDHHKPVTMALVYCGTIVLVLTIAAVALLNFFQALSVNPWTNFALGALFIFFALSLFGMYEIELPSGLARFTSEREGKGGLIGTIFMALTFTIISFACVAPFLGGFGGTAAGVQRPLWHTILGGIAFSATFAFPFFLLALFPALLKKMPKSGSWLNSVKVVMGFLELAAAVKFLRAGELAGSTTTPSFFTYDFSLGLYVALCILCGLYLLGIYRLPHDTPAENLSVPRLMFSLVFLALAFYLTPALFTRSAEGGRQRPGGTIYAWVDAFLLPEAQPAGEEVWTGNLEYAVNRAREHLRRTGQPKLVFVDFTGKICTNCRLNEQNVLSKPEIKKLLQQYELVQLYTDYVPADFYSPEARAQLTKDSSRLRTDAVEVNLKFQKAVLNTTELPQYVVLEPRLDDTIRVLGVQRQLLQLDSFAQFLKSPQTSAGPVAQARGG